MGDKKGTVKFYNKERRFGFIKPDNGGNDIFFFIKAWKEDVDPKEGDSVVYSERINERKQKLEAYIVSRVEQS